MVKETNGDPDKSLDYLLTDTFSDVDAGPTSADVAVAQSVAAPTQLKRPADHRPVDHRPADHPAKLKKQESLRQLHKMASIRNEQRRNDALLLKLRGLIGMEQKEDPRLISDFNPNKK